MSELYTIGSMCSGMEAASVALNPLGFKTLWLSEIDAAPCSVLASHHPTVPNLGDMRKIPALIRDCFVPAPDMLCGGTPCQAFSIASLRNSLDDERGNLSLIFCETADEIDKRRAADGLLPAVILWENVPGVLSTADNAFGCFLAGLAGEDDPIESPGAKWTNAGCVYGPKRTVAWRVFDAQYFGVAQRRRRVFVVASAREGFDPAAILFEFDGVRRDSAPSREAWQDATDAVGTGATFSCGGIGKYSSSSSTEVFGALSSSSPQAQAVMENQRGELRMSSATNALSCGGGKPGQGYAAALVGMAVRRLMPVECLRLQGYPDDFFTGVLHRGKPLADGPMYKMIGNSWAVPNIVWIGKRIRAALDRSAA